jgi:hypothetical protein
MFHHGVNFPAKALFVKLERFFARAVEQKIRIHLHAVILL